MAEKQIQLQPASKPDMTLPYPYFISENGDVGRQDFWKGEPKKLIGFAKSLKVNVCRFTVNQLFEDPESVIGLYPVFANETGQWHTCTDKIATAKFI